MNLYAYVGNDPVNRNDPTGKYSCGKSLSSGECFQFRSAQGFAILRIRGRIDTLRSASSKLASGEKLTRQEKAAVGDVTKFYGSKGATSGGISKAIGNANKVLGELEGSKPAELGDFPGSARVNKDGPGILLGTNFFEYSTTHQAFTLAHEGGHTWGLL